MKGMNKEELRRRVEAWAVKKKKLEEPNFHVSNVRLAVRNIPKSVTASRLRAVFYDTANKIRAKQNKDGASTTNKYEYSNPKIEQSIIARSQDRLDENGVGRSKRYGFVQFREHMDSLCVLRELNNKMNIFDNNKNNGRIQIEFALEDMRKLHIREQRVEKSKAKMMAVELENMEEKLEIVKQQQQWDQGKKIEEKIASIRGKINKQIKQKNNKIILKNVMLLWQIKTTNN